MSDNVVKSATTEKRERVRWIDFAKGIVILLVIVGHSVGSGAHSSLLRGMIYSFHMPFFFILSCATFRFSVDRKDFVKRTKRAAKHLMVPAVIMFVVRMILYYYFKTDHVYGLVAYCKQAAGAFIFASGVHTQICGHDIMQMGILWFLFVLFIGRTLFDLLHLATQKKEIVFLIFTILLGIVGVLIGIRRTLPFSIDLALAIMPFLYFGYRLKNFKVEKRAFLKMVFWAVVWAVLLFLTYHNVSQRTYMELAERRYSYFPICYVIAIAGTMAVSQFSVLCCRLKNVTKPLIYLGKNSLYLLLVHVVDFSWTWIWAGQTSQTVHILLRMATDLIVFAVVMLIKRQIGVSRGDTSGTATGSSYGC